MDDRKPGRKPKSKEPVHVTVTSGMDRHGRLCLRDMSYELVIGDTVERTTEGHLNPYRVGQANLLKRMAKLEKRAPNGFSVTVELPDGSKRWFANVADLEAALPELCMSE